MKKRYFKGTLLESIALVLFVMPAVTLPMEAMQTWELIIPEGAVGIEPIKVNPHPSSLVGKTVMLRWNGEPNGDKFLNGVAGLLTDKVKDVKIIKAWEVAPDTVDPITGSWERSKEFAAKIASFKPDIVIASQADAPSSTAWLVTDQVELEKMGIPTVTVINAEFLALAKDTTVREGAFDFCFVVLPGSIRKISATEIRKKGEEVFPEILKLSTEWKPSGQLPPIKLANPAKRIKFEGRVEDVQRLFIDRGWSIGLPIVPPTPERVTQMLKGTSRKPQDFVGLVPPRMGLLTVELVATHAVMAGCRPEYMPVLLAALEALLAPKANWRMVTTTEATTSVLVIVNGPIVKELGIAYSEGAAGADHHANASIGYAINLISDVVGGSLPPAADRSTLGGPGDFVCWIFGENEDMLPKGWEPYHVSRGFKKSDSVVTAMGIYPPVDNGDRWSRTPEEHINWWARLVTPLLSIGGTCWGAQMEQPYIVGLCPEHARLLAEAGWTEDQFKKAFWEKARIPFSSWPRACSGREILEKKFGPITPDTLIPITFNPEDFQIVLAGGAGMHSHFFAPVPGCFPVSRLVKE
ncbi:MAG: UGSC family (seleno)protein [Thermodesulfobacteriota bacterium]